MPENVKNQEAEIAFSNAICVNEHEDDDGGQQEAPRVVEPPQREVWGKGREFVLACVGFSVGLGNIWRFPYLAYKNGGGAFLIPYFIYVICGGVPLTFMEVGLGQFMRQGNVNIWNICPIFKGIGIGTTIMVVLCNVYYIILLAWGLHFLYASTSSLLTGNDLPWAGCGNEWNTENCFHDGQNNNNTNASDPADEYWEYRVLGLSGGLDEVGSLRWDLVLWLVVAWILVYGCVFKGVRSSGKVVYFTATFPYLMLVVLFVRGVTLEGASKGLLFYLKPDFNRLTDTQVWIDAGTQVFYSYCCTFGGLVSLGSYNKFNRDFIRDNTFTAIVCGATSLFGGCVIFSVLGYMSEMSGVPIDKVAGAGPGLAFIVYPKAVSLMPGAAVWAVLFFFMIVLIAVDTQFVTVEAVATILMDNFSGKILKTKYEREIITAISCFIQFAPGLLMVTQGGIYLFQLFDYYAASGLVLLAFCFCECAAVAWVYGVDRWKADVEQMIGRKISVWLKICWAYVTPLLTLGLLFLAVVNYKPLVYNDVYVYPLFGQLLGGFLALSSIIFVPLYFLYALITAPGVKISEKWKHAIKPQMEETLALRQQQEMWENCQKA